MREISEIYHGFDDWKDVQEQYEMSEPEAEEVICAYYGADYCYSGESLVVYRNGGNYFLNEGSHCSCYGLEGQWAPTLYESKELFIACFEKQYFYAENMQRSQKDVLKYLKTEVKSGI